MLFRGLVAARQHHVGFGFAAVGDEDLAAVENPVVAVAGGGGLGAARIGAGGGLGQAEAAEFLARGQGHEEFLLLFLGAEHVDRVGAEGQVGRQGDAGGAADAGQFLDRDGVADVVGAAAAVLFGEDDPGQAEFAQPVVHQGPVETFFLVADAGRRRDLGLGETPDHVTDQLLLFGQFEIHVFSPWKFVML